ncbi:MAG: outer membrane lipoprotein-sorting protein [Desulfuromonas sp.]|uniref:outer membrane lipoprotein-sorting protein n=1 Tax=Desulfuromonas sp. TaxID=892 RepID=UPI000CC9C566|nr:outer membrane lipoprotein-sorting protein [Desulfuromonas sp.]PLX86493.1 MAG: outer membrane lipoprotein-sorting protein [Desulfuromonas sp.]
MKTVHAVPLIVLLLLLTAPAGALDLRQLIREVEDQHMGRSSEARMTMQVRTEHWERNLEMEAWSLGRDHFLVRILDPPKDRGVATLKVGKEVWNYLPKVDRTIKVPPSMMGGAWMGSHITNNDLVKAAHVDEDYDFRLLEETEALWTIEGIARPEAAVVWGKIVYAVEKAHRVPQRIAYFDEEMLKVREIVFDDVQTVGERTIPMRMTVQPLDKPEEVTIMHYGRLSFDVPLKESFFSLRQLKSR